MSNKKKKEFNLKIALAMNLINFDSRTSLRVKNEHSLLLAEAEAEASSSISRSVTSFVAARIWRSRPWKNLEYNSTKKAEFDARYTSSRNGIHSWFVRTSCDRLNVDRHSTSWLSCWYRLSDWRSTTILT